MNAASRELLAAWAVTPAGRRYPPEEAPRHETGVAASWAHVPGPDGVTRLGLVELAPPAATVDPLTGVIRWDQQTARAVAAHLVRAADHLAEREAGR